MQEKVLRAPGMVSIVATFASVIASLSLLIPASPAWVAFGGAGSTGAGSVTATLMAVTVATQLFAVRALLARFGWAKTLVAGTLLMGLGSPLQAISPDLTLALLSSALRGIGFGIVTVCGSTALSILIPAAQRGRAVGIYGLAAAIPQMILTPSAPWLIEVLGFRAVLTLGAVAVFGAPFALHLGRIVDARIAAAPAAEPDSPGGAGGIVRLIWPALLTLTLVTAAGGAFMTFAIDLAPTALWAAVALLCLTVMATPTRFWGGSLSDRFGTRVLMTPALALAAVGMALVGWSVAAAGTPRLVLLVAGALLIGFGYGFLQSVTLVRALNDAGPTNNARASVAWNANFDVGTGLGGLAVGAMAQAAGFFVAWWIWAVLVVLAVAVMAMRDFRKPRQAT